MSPDGNSVAIVVPSSSHRRLIQVYDVSSSSTCTLSLTLTHTTEEPLNELIFGSGSDKIMARFGTTSIIEWDINRGVVSHKLTVGDDQRFLGLASSSLSSSADNDDDDSKYYVLSQHSQKLYVYEHSSSTNKVVRKIKSGRWEEDDENTPGRVSLAVSDSHVVVQTGSSCRIMDLTNGKKVGKLKNMASPSSIRLGKDRIAVLTASGVRWYGVEGGKPQPTHQSIPHDGGSTLQIRNDDDGWVLIDDTVYDENEGEKITTISGSHPTALCLTASNTVLALVYQKKNNECLVHSIDLKDDDIPSSINLDETMKKEPTATESSSSSAATTTSKRKTPLMMGPGQAGGEAVVPPAKKSKQDDVDMEDADDDGEDEKGLSIGERLKQLSRALDEDDEEEEEEEEEEVIAKASTSFKPKKATTESLKELLTQALQSGDDALLELAFGVRDKKTITNTLKEIEPSLVEVLLNKLTSRLASTPMRADQLAVWLSCSLKKARRPLLGHQLTALRNLLYERIESFPDLLKLEGRLSVMCDVE